MPDLRHHQLLAPRRDPSYHRFLELKKEVDKHQEINFMSSHLQPSAQPFPFIERMQLLLELIGYPMRGAKVWFDRVILVGGTFGKGSVASALQENLALTETTGLFMSPPLLSWCDTVSIASPNSPQQNISAVPLCRLYQKALNSFLTAHHNEEWPIEFGWPSHFELLLAVALLHFREQACTQVVLEVGCGGARDATNAVPHEVAVITGVGHDHMPLLGRDLNEVAKEKSGIITGGQVFCAESDPIINAVFERVSAKNAARFFAFKHTQQFPDWNHAFADFIASQLGFAVSAHRPVAGRFDDFERVIVDGAHNPEKCQALVEHLKSRGHTQLHCLLAIRDDKEVEAMVERLDAIVDAYTLTQVGVDNASGHSATMPTERLLSRVRAVSEKPITSIQDFETALSQSVQAITVESDKRLLITGSFSTAAAALRWLAGDSYESAAVQ